jgi:hypothetical protein
VVGQSKCSAHSSTLWIVGKKGERARHEVPAAVDFILGRPDWPGGLLSLAVALILVLELEPCAVDHWNEATEELMLIQRTRF